MGWGGVGWGGVGWGWGGVGVGWGGGGVGGLFIVAWCRGDGQGMRVFCGKCGKGLCVYVAGGLGGAEELH